MKNTCNASPTWGLPTPAIAPVPTLWPHRLHTKQTEELCTKAPAAQVPPHPSPLTAHRSPLEATTRLIVPDCTIPFTDGHYGKHDINLAEHCGDYIIRRKDGAWAYQLAVVVDDALMGVTEIVRGRDLLLSLPQQIHLRELLFPSPLTVDFFHHPLLCNSEGQRLCKRDKSMDLEYLRGTGITPQEIIGKLAYLAGLTDTTTPITPSELLPLFSWDKVPTNDIRVKL